jgi:hypothetical protein
LRVGSCDRRRNRSVRQLDAVDLEATVRHVRGEHVRQEAAELLTSRAVADVLANLWVTETTALATALNMSYMAEQISLFGIVVGIALLLSGIGFIVLALGVLQRDGGAAAPA